jgi:anti-sigma factor ChrR (cupin superfamily)
MVRHRQGGSRELLKVSQDDHDPPWPGGEALTYKQRALLLWARAREVHSPETRAEFERLARMYERLAIHEQRAERGVETLGELLCAEPGATGNSEREWVALLRGVARGDRRALQTLYRWTHRFVSAFVRAGCADAAAAEPVTSAVFQDVWQRAASYDPGGDTVVSWIMNQARSRAAGRSPVTPGAHEGAPDLRQPLGEPAIEDEPGMTEPAPGISCKMLATDFERRRLSLLVGLAPGIEYPPHTHAGVEQLYLLRGELWIGDRKLHPGDYNRAEPGTADELVWSETGCLCILVTSSDDRL